MRKNKTNKKIAKLLLLFNIGIIFSSACFNFLMAAPVMAKEAGSTERTANIFCEHANATDGLGLNRTEDIMPCCYQKNDSNKENGLSYQAELIKFQTRALFDLGAIADNFQINSDSISSFSPPPEQILLASVVKRE